MLHNENYGSLEVVIRNASNLDDVESAGKNDAYAQVTLDLKNPNAFQKTKTHNNCGKNATWEHTLVLEGASPQHNILYVEVMEADIGADAPIGFTAINLEQIRISGPLSGNFNLFTPGGTQKGEIGMSLRFLGGLPATQTGHGGGANVNRGEMIHEHQMRMLSLKKKEQVEDAALGAALALAAAGGAYMLSGGDNKKKTEADKRDAHLSKN
ncbi:hypothetical protein BG004_001934 [Podila humilis]|nr:hypothetical protein BG004_001934 [Podila humilis]